MPLLKEVTTVLKAAQKLGAATPPAMQAVLETFVRMYGPPGVTRGVTSPAPEYRAIVSKAAESGQAPEREEIRKAMRKAALSKVLGEELLQHADATDMHAADLMLELIKGDAGDLWFDSPRPAFDKALAGIVAAAAHYSPDATPDQVLEMPAEASEALRSARAHQQVLDQLFTTVIRPLHRLRVLPLETEPDWELCRWGAVHPARQGPRAGGCGSSVQRTRGPVHHPRGTLAAHPGSHGSAAQLA